MLTHHWHVGFHLAFCVGLIYLVYTPHHGVDSISQIAPTAGLSVRWPADLVKIGVPTLFVYGMMGTFPAIALFSYFIFVTHFSRRFCASHDIPERTTTDHVLVAMLALFALHMAGVVTGLIDENLWGKNGAPPAIRVGAAVMMLAMAIEARRRMAVVTIIFLAAGYYFGGGIGDFTWGIVTTALN